MNNSYKKLRGILDDALALLSEYDEDAAKQFNEKLPSRELRSVIPQWLYEVSPDSRLSARDIADILCAKSTSYVHERVHRGEFPPAEFKNGNKFLWSVGTVLAWCQQQGIDGEGEDDGRRSGCNEEEIARIIAGEKADEEVTRPTSEVRYRWELFIPKAKNLVRYFHRVMPKK